MQRTTRDDKSSWQSKSSAEKHQPSFAVRIVYLPLYGTERRQPAYGQRASRLTSKLWYICSSCHIFQSLPLFYFTFFSFSSLYNFRFINFSFRRFRLSNKRRIKIHFFENRSTYISVVYEFVFIFLKKKKKRKKRIRNVRISLFLKENSLASAELRIEVKAVFNDERNPKTIDYWQYSFSNRLGWESQKLDFGQTGANCITFNIE